MAQTTSAEEKIRELHSAAARDLVNAHAKLKEEPLVLAIRYEGDEPFDVYLFEVLARFPGEDDDDFFPMEFEPSAGLRMVGKLQLVLCSAAQLRAAIKRKDALIAKLAQGTVLYEDGGESKDLKSAIGL